VAPCFFLDLALVIVVFPISFPGLHHCVTVYRSTKLERHSVELASPPKSLIPQILLLLNAEENKPSVDCVAGYDSVPTCKPSVVGNDSVPTYKPSVAGYNSFLTYTPTVAEYDSVPTNEPSVADYRAAST